MAQITVLTEDHKNSLKDLAQAIRIGAAVRPQHYGTLFGRRNGVICSCAMGAAWEGMEPTFDVKRWLSDSEYHGLFRFSVLDRLDIGNVLIENPFKPGRAHWLVPTIAYLNDNHKWTREQIADWLDQLAA